MRRFLSSVLEVFEIAVIAVGAVFIIRTFLVQPFLVSGASMAPSFMDGDYLLIDELTYRVREPNRGEVAVFRSPQEEEIYFIKRIIGLPGERIKIENGVIRIFSAEEPKGFVLDEEYIKKEIPTIGSVDVTLSTKQYFVLGDNRAYSYDSRQWGLLDDKKIIGLVRLRLWPPKNATVFAAPQY
ncbi:MAG: signal peptidase I [Patescibacteria group bacterium]